MSSNDFPKVNRLLNKQDFDRVYRHGRLLDTNNFKFYVLTKSEERPRLGIVTTRRLGNAVERNRIKRCIREIFRKNKERFSNLDVIVKPESETVLMSNSELKNKFLNNFSAGHRGGSNGKDN